MRIYWSNHHHMFQVVERVNGTVLWGNLHLLFWLSLFPFTTAWVEETTFSRTPVIVYGVNLLLAAVAYYVLQLAIFRVEGGSGGSCPTDGWSGTSRHGSRVPHQGRS